MQHKELMQKWIVTVKNNALSFGSEFNKARFIGWAKENEGKKLLLQFKKPKRSLNQLSYVHVLFEYIANETGNTKEETKVIEKRRHLTPKKVTAFDQEHLVLPSLATINKADMSEFIERVQADCAFLGIVIPTKEELGYLPS